MAGLLRNDGELRLSTSAHFARGCVILDEFSGGIFSKIFVAFSDEIVIMVGFFTIVLTEEKSPTSLVW